MTPICTRLLDRLQHQRRGEPGRALAVQAPATTPRQRLLDLRRGPVQLQGGQRPESASPRCTSEGRERPSRRCRSTRRSRRSTRSLKEIASRGGIVAGVLSPFLTVEEAYLLARYLKGLSPANVLALGPIPVSGNDQTFRPDQTKGRTGDTSFVVPRPFTIHAEKCPNRRGVEAILEHFQGQVIHSEEFTRRLEAGEFQGLYVASRRHRSLDRRAPGRGARGRPSSSSSCRTRRSRRWRIGPTWCWRARPSPRRPAATSTPTAGSSMPRPRFRRATARCPTSTSSRSC